MWLIDYLFKNLDGSWNWVYVTIWTIVLSFIISGYIIDKFKNIKKDSKNKKY
jgi:hypothetical protein